SSAACAVRLLVTLPRRRPSSPLFPYTTLFRSSPSGCHPGSTRGWSTSSVCLGPLARLSTRAKTDVDQDQFLMGTEDDLCICRPGDRKSTRLNSSHVSISYAVLCLKQKRHNPPE